MDINRMGCDGLSYHIPYSAPDTENIALAIKSIIPFNQGVGTECGLISAPNAPGRHLPASRLPYCQVLEQIGTIRPHPLKGKKKENKEITPRRLPETFVRITELINLLACGMFCFGTCQV